MAIEFDTGGVTTLASPIHRSKITVPPASGIARPGLLTKLDQAALGKLTVLAAPAGWGKSSLLAQWASSTTMDVAWIALDDDDDDPARFLRALVSALDPVCPLQVDDLLAMLRSPSPPGDDYVEMVLIARLEAVPGPIAIVLDDFHALTVNGALPTVCRLLEHLPSHIHLLVASRGEPGIPLARLRSAGVVTVLRPEDLAFTIDEAREALGLLAGVELSTDDARLLVERTEGWIAGLRLAGASLANQADRPAAIARVRGTNRDIADYFSEEVLDPLGPDLRAVLVETSIVPAFCETLVTAITGRPDAYQLIASTAATDLFLVPLDANREWHRYHGLFHDLLRADFGRLPPAWQAELHRRAAGWYERQGDIRQAVEEALATGDLPLAASLIEHHADTLMFVCGEINLLIGWFGRIPGSLITERRGLLRAYAWALTAIGRIDDAEQLLDRVHAAFAVDSAALAPEATGAWSGQLSAIRARIAAYRGDHQATIEHGQRALESLDRLRDGRLHGDVVLSIGFAERALGNTEAAATAFGEAARLGRLHGNVQAARWGVCYLAITRMSQGRLTEAAAIVDEDLDRVRGELADPGSMLPALLISKAEILIERNDLAAARPLLDAAIPLVQRVGDAKMLHVAYIAMGLLLRAEGDLAGAREKMRRAEEIFPSAIRGARVAWMALAQGNVPEARRWALASGFGTDDVPDPARGEYEQVIFARIVATTDPSPATRGLVQRLIDDAEAGGRYGRAIELLVILAMSAWEDGERDWARHALCRALGLARHEGFARIFVNEGAPMQALLRELARDRDLLDGPTRHYVLGLLGQFPSATDPGASASVLAEPLTARQLEILHLLAVGRSNRDIAGDLFIAEGTVKAHMHQLFGKLVARNRTEAVANARDLNLLP